MKGADRGQDTEEIGGQGCDASQDLALRWEGLDPLRVDEARDWMRVLLDLYHQRKTPHAIVAVDDEQSDSVTVATSVFVEDVPDFLHDAASAVEEPEQNYLIDNTAH